MIYPVSIPIWCDWKMEESINKVQVALFQFLYGAIGRGNQYLEKGKPILCFNSYMVRLEDYLDGLVQKVILWFQFLYGAIGSSMAMR